MNKEEICNRLCSVCNSLNDLTVTGIHNISIVAGAHSILRETLEYLATCEITPSDKEKGGKM